MVLIGIQSTTLAVTAALTGVVLVAAGIKLKKGNRRDEK